MLNINHPVKNFWCCDVSMFNVTEKLPLKASCEGPLDPVDLKDPLVFFQKEKLTQTLSTVYEGEMKDRVTN